MEPPIRVELISPGTSAGDFPLWLDYAARSIWCDVVQPNPGGLMRYHLHNVSKLCRSSLEGSEARIEEAVVADVDISALPKGASWKRGSLYVWAFLRWLVTENRTQEMLKQKDSHVVDLGSWQAVASAVLGHKARKAESEGIRILAHRIAACSFRGTHKGTMFDLKGTQFTLNDTD